MLKEPDPEEHEEAMDQLEQAKEEKIITDSLYSSIINQQFELEQNGEFNVQLSGTTITSAFFSGN